MNIRPKQISTLNAYTFEFEPVLLQPIRDLYGSVIPHVLERHPELLVGGVTIRFGIDVPPLLSSGRL
jgi:hypothetical protein